MRAQPSTTVTLARHGRTPWHDGDRYAGSSDIEIDEVGRRQAQQLAAWAREAKPDVLYSSTMIRTRQTAAPVAEALGLPLHTDERLREVDFGEMEGRSLADLKAEDPRAVELFEQDAAAHHLPGGEHPEAAADRAVAALSDIVDRHRGDNILIVCHNTTIRLVACRYLGIPLGTYRSVLRGIAPVATTRFSFRPDGSVMLDYYNRRTDG